MQLFLITRTTIKKGNSRGKIPLPLNLNNPFKSRTRSSDAELARLQQQYGAEAGRARADQVFLLKYFVAL